MPIGINQSKTTQQAIAVGSAEAKKKADELKAARIAEINASGYVPADMINANTGGIAGGNPQVGMGDLYRDAVSQWYDTGLNSKGLLSEDYTYRPELIDMNQLQMANPYDFNPMRQEAMNELQSQQLRDVCEKITKYFFIEIYGE